MLGNRPPPSVVERMLQFVLSQLVNIELKTSVRPFLTSDYAAALSRVATRHLELWCMHNKQFYSPFMAEGPALWTKTMKSIKVKFTFDERSCVSLEDALAQGHMTQEQYDFAKQGRVPSFICLVCAVTSNRRVRHVCPGNPERRTPNPR